MVKSEKRISKQGHNDDTWRDKSRTMMETIQENNEDMMKSDDKINKSDEHYNDTIAKWWRLMNKNGNWWKWCALEVWGVQRYVIVLDWNIYTYIHVYTYIYNMFSFLELILIHVTYYDIYIYIYR